VAFPGRHIGGYCWLGCHQGVVRGKGVGGGHARGTGRQYCAQSSYPVPRWLELSASIVRQSHATEPRYDDGFWFRSQHVPDGAAQMCVLSRGADLMIESRLVAKGVGKNCLGGCL